jgi:hypothetical protein
LQVEIFITFTEQYSDNVHQNHHVEKKTFQHQLGLSILSSTLRGSQKTRVTVAFGGQLFSVQSSITIPVSPYMAG